VSRRQGKSNSTTNLGAPGPSHLGTGDGTSRKPAASPGPAFGTRESKKPSLPGRLLPRSFFLPAPERVAPRLLGKLLVHRTPAGVMAGRIVEAEAYLGPHQAIADPAAHSHRGMTARNCVIFGPPGRAYLYFIYGRYFCMNVTCEPEGQAGCVLLRALEPVAGLALMAHNRGLTPDAPPCDISSGPSRLCLALDLTRAAHNGLDLIDPASPLQLRDDGYKVTQALVTVRIGLSQAAELPLRFAMPGNACVSGRKSLAGTYLSLR
jgi:DNA-3-methyladenine glycosylase